VLGVVFIAVAASGCFGIYSPVPSGSPIPTLTATPAFTLSAAVEDFVPLADESMLSVAGCTGLQARHPDGSISTLAEGRCGPFPLLVSYTSLALDPNFASNRLVYTCTNVVDSFGQRGVVTQWRVAADFTTATANGDIVTGIPGCRSLRFKPGTGELFISGVADRILRVDQLGHALPGNAGIAWDPRIYSYGHAPATLIAFTGSGAGYAFDEAVHYDLTSGIGHPLPPWPSVHTVYFLVPGPAGPAAARDVAGLPDSVLFLLGSRWKGLEGAVATAAHAAPYSAPAMGVSAAFPNIRGFFDSSHSPIQIFDRSAIVRVAALAPNGDLYVGVTTSAGTDVSKVSPT
jgi:hypothetical protein